MISQDHISLLIDRARKRHGISDAREYLKIADVCKMTGFTTDTVKKMVRRNKMVRPSSMSGHWRWSADTWFYWWIAQPVLPEPTGKDQKEVDENALLDEARQLIIEDV